jgi:hypothetical protein
MTIGEKLLRRNGGTDAPKNSRYGNKEQSPRRGNRLLEFESSHPTGASD